MTDSVDEFFAGYPPQIEAISRHLRELVTEAMPDANETLYASQNHVGYSPTKSSYDQVCYICPLPKYVRLGFMFGAHLPNPEQLLVGEGKRLRHIKVYTLDEANNPALKFLLKAAWADVLPRVKKKL